MPFPQIIFLVLLGTLPSLGWLWFYLRKDLHPEPKRLLTLVFLGGVLITVPIAAIEQTLAQYIPGTNILFLAAGTLEELAKLFVFWLLIWLWHDRAFDEPVDAMIYLITAALGFAAAENIANLFQASGGLGEYVGLMSARFLGATLLHTLGSGILGFFIARFHFLHKIKGKLHHGLWIKGVILASGIHTLFNILISSAQNNGNLLAVTFVITLLIVGSIVVSREFTILKEKVKLRQQNQSFAHN